MRKFGEYALMAGIVAFAVWVVWLTVSRGL